MPLIQAIKGRRAVRSYLDRPVPRHVIGDLIDAAAAAPSAMNLQPWSFAVIEGAERLAGMSTQAKRYLLSSRTPETSLAMHRASLEDPSFNIFYGDILRSALSDHRLRPAALAPGDGGLLPRRAEPDAGGSWPRTGQLLDRLFPPLARAPSNPGVAGLAAGSGPGGADYRRRTGIPSPAS